MHFFCTSLFILMSLLGCGKSQSVGSVPLAAVAPESLPGSNPNVSNDQQVLEFGYQFFGKDSAGNECSTKIHNYESIDAMCVNIMDPIKNENCAILSRIGHFNEKCSPLGFDHYESHECTFALLKNQGNLPDRWPLDERKVIKMMRFCTGRTSSGKILRYIFDRNVNFHAGISAGVSMEFVPRLQSNLRRFSKFNFALYATYVSGRKYEIYRASEYRDGNRFVKGYTYGNDYQYALRCVNTWACE